MRKIKSKYFIVDSIRFKIYLNGSELILERINTKLINIFGDEEDSVSIIGDTKNPIKIIRKAVNEVINYIKENKINNFTFSASEDSRKKLYNRLVYKISNALNLECILDNGYYYLYKT